MIKMGGAGEEFLLKWNDHRSSFASMMEALCLTEEMVDCTISAGTKSFSAHRMVLSTCSPYFRSLFSSVPRWQHPILFLKDVDTAVVELLLRYMYSGQVSVSEDQLSPLVTAAKSLSIKGLLDVNVPDSPEKTTSKRLSDESPTRQAPGTPKPTPAKKQKSEEVQLALPPPARIGEVDVFPSDQRIGDGNGNFGIDFDDDNSFDEYDNTYSNSQDEGVDPTAITSEAMDQNHLLRRLTSEMTAFPFSGGGPSGGMVDVNPSPAQLTIFSCEHCGKEFTSKRKHQRHVLNVHFGYNPVQCPYCNKGHRDNYNLKQHVCPVLNMKYGVFEKTGKIPGGLAGLSSSSSSELEAQSRNLFPGNSAENCTNGKSGNIDSHKNESS